MKCVGCGACCVYYQISVNDESKLPLVAIRESDFPKKIWKEAGEICSNLKYNPQEDKFECKIHEENNRPIVCQRFNCGYLTKQERTNLEKVAKELREIYCKL